MIRQLCEGAPVIPPDEGIAGGYVRSLYEAYSLSFDFLRFYHDDGSCCIAVMDNTATVCGEPDDAEELAWFLSVQPEIATVRTNEKTAGVLHGLWPESSVTIRPVMRCVSVPAIEGETVVPSVKVLYSLLSASFPNMTAFESWYLDVCYRLRHQYCHIAAVTEGDRVVSSAMTVAEWKEGAVIGAVATDTAHRQKGYASLCVSSLTAQMCQLGKTVYICPKTAQAQRLYERIGFSVCDSLALIDIPRKDVT